MNISVLVLAPLKLNVGSFAAFAPSAFFRNATWAFSSRVAIFRNAAGLRAERQVRRGRAVVEGRLEVLERERVVEDADIALAELGRGATATRRRKRARGERSEQRAAADGRAAGNRGLAQERRTRVAPGRPSRAASCDSATAPSGLISLRLMIAWLMVVCLLGHLRMVG